MIEFRCAAHREPLVNNRFLCGWFCPDCGHDSAVFGTADLLAALDAGRIRQSVPAPDGSRTIGWVPPTRVGQKGKAS